jgi:hypothetical protein
MIKVDAGGNVIAGAPASSVGDRNGPTYKQPDIVLGYELTKNDVVPRDLQEATNNRNTYIPVSNFSSLTKKITFYNKGGDIATMNYEAFKTAVKSINLSN